MSCARLLWCAMRWTCCILLCISVPCPFIMWVTDFVFFSSHAVFRCSHLAFSSVQSIFLFIVVFPTVVCPVPLRYFLLHFCLLLLPLHMCFAKLCCAVVGHFIFFFFRPFFECCYPTKQSTNMGVSQASCLFMSASGPMTLLKFWTFAILASWSVEGEGHFVISCSSFFFTNSIVCCSCVKLWKS